jgi:hypothetical protein
MAERFLLFIFPPHKFLDAILLDEGKVSRNRPVGDEGVLTLSRIKKPGYPLALSPVAALGACLKAFLLDAAGDKTAGRVLLLKIRAAAAGTP